MEASIVGSIILAGGVLKLGILYYWNFRILMIIRSLVVFSLSYIIATLDGKRFAAYSSVLHMTLCVIVGIIVILLVGYIHIILSPLIFMSIYIIYVISGSRFYIKGRIIIIILWMINFGLPFLRGFFSEVYIMVNNGVILLILLIMYMVARYVMIKSINEVRSRLVYVP